MREVKYHITDELGLHARPAGRLVKVLSAFGSDVRLSTPNATVDGKRLMGVMGLTAKQGDELTLTFEGGDEEAAAAAAQSFLEENL